MSINLRPYEASNLISNDINSILDLGCRDKLLKNYINDDIKYTGVDFEASEDVISYNLENGIPCNDNSYECVLALDVLEHLENIHYMIEEMKRVSKKEIIIALPNLYYYRFRFKYLFGYSLGAKYDLPLNKILDRHRWLTSYNNSKYFIENSFAEYNVSISFAKTSKIKIIDIFDRILQKVFPNLASHTVLFYIDLRKYNEK